jgi:hypothetical protein
MQAMNSIYMSEKHEKKIKQLEQREKMIIEGLQTTIKLNSNLMNDLSKQS